VEKRLTYNIQIERDEDGKYVVSVPALKGCFTQGKNFDQALIMAQDAILGFITVLARRGKKIPIEKSRTSPFAVSVNFPKVLA
jgi:antitoxin HicB